MGSKTMKGSNENRQTLVLLLLLFVFAFAKSVFFSRYGFGLLDEGENLHNGLRILRGDMPYKDFYTLLPPLDNFWPAIAFRLFGISIFSPRLLSSIVFAFLPPTLFLITKKNVSIWLALIPAVLIIFLDLNIERIYFFSFIFAGLLLYINSLDTSNQIKKIIAGILIGVGGLIRLDLAGGFLLGIVLTGLVKSLSVQKKRKFVLWWFEIQGLIVGFAVVICLMFVWLNANGLVVGFFEAFFINSLGVTDAYSIPFPRIWEIIPTNFSINSLYNSYKAFFAYYILTTYAIFSVYLFRNLKKVWENNIELATIFIIGIFISPYMLGRTDIGHLMKGGMPFLVLCTFLISEGLKFKNNKRLFRKLFLLAGPAVILLVSIVQSIWWVNFNDTKTDFSMGTVYLNSHYPSRTTLISAASIVKAVEYVNNNSSPDEPYLTVPYLAGLYFLTNRVSQFYVDNIFVGFLEDEKLFVENVARSNIKLVIYDRENGPQSQKPRLMDYYPILDRYIMQNFETVEKTPEGLMLMKKIQN